MATWTDATAVAEWMGLPNLAADPTLAHCVAAVQAYQQSHLDATALAAAITAPVDPDLLTATWMRTSALWKRRQTPDGISSVGDFAVMRVSDRDPDIARLEQRFWAFGYA